MPTIIFEDGQQMDLEEFLDQQPKNKPLDPRGREILDPTPIAPPVGHIRQPSLTEQIREMVKSEKLRQEAESAGAESFDEADDFDIGDDYDPTSPYEQEFEPTPVPELRRRKKAAEDAPPPETAPTPPPEPKETKPDETD